MVVDGEVVGLGPGAIVEHAPSSKTGPATLRAKTASKVVGTRRGRTASTQRVAAGTEREGWPARWAESAAATV